MQWQRGAAGRPFPVLGAERGQPLELRSPVITAAGCGGDGRSLSSAPWLAELGAFTTPSFTTEPYGGGGRPPVIESVAGVLYSPVPANRGLGRTLDRLDQLWASLLLPVVLSVLPQSATDLERQLLLIDEAPSAAAVEINLELVAQALPDRSAWPRTLRALLLPIETFRLPVLLKLPADDDAVQLAQLARTASVDAVVVAAGRPASAVEWDRGLANVPYLLAGPAIFPQTLALVQSVAAAAEIPVIACGGVDSVAKAAACLNAGAIAVQVGTALFRDPLSTARISRGISGTAGTGKIALAP